MILQKLCEYYDRLDADPDIAIAQQGFAPQQVVFAVVIETDGSLHAIQPVGELDGKKITPKSLKLPDCGKRTSGVKAQFMWDKAEYLLGWSPPEIAVGPPDETAEDEEKREKKKQRIKRCFEACRDLHIGFLDEIDTEAYLAVCNFFREWQAEKLTEADLDTLNKIGSGFGVFRLRGNSEYIHDLVAIREFWETHNSCSNTDVIEKCLVVGKEMPIARLHPNIKGFKDQQNIVAFNKGKNAYESYGNVDAQGLNAPVGVTTAFKYTTALNWMLAKGSERRLSIGETTVVFWADQPSQVEDIFEFSLNPSNVAEDNARTNEIRSLLKRISAGEVSVPDADVPFHILGLSDQVKARLSIRFWISGTAGDLIQRVAAHQQRLEIVKGPNDRDALPLWLLLAQTARESKEIQPLLGGALLRSVLTGGRYPESMLAAVVRRIRAEREIRHPKAAIIKAVLNHNYQKEISVMLDTQRTESAYHLGRLFACLERAQEDALPGLNATIKDRYFGSASSTPSTVFPRLIRMSQHHVGKLEGGKKVVAEKRLQEIMGRLDTFPSHFGLADQGLFAIGYYHQRQDFFTKKPKQSDEDNDQS